MQGEGGRTEMSACARCVGKEQLEWFHTRDLDNASFSSTQENTGSQYSPVYSTTMHAPSTVYKDGSSPKNETKTS